MNINNLFRIINEDGNFDKRDLLLRSDFESVLDNNLYLSLIEKDGKTNLFYCTKMPDGTIVQEVLTDENFNSKGISVNQVNKSSMQYPEIPGLSFQQVPADGHCLFHAVGLYVGQDQQFLRNIVTAHLKHNLEKFRLIIETMNPGRTAEEYLRAVQEGVEWADNLEIAVLMSVLNRPIVIIEPTGEIRNRNDLGKFNGEPIFIYYNRHTHYDAYVKEGDHVQGQEILQGLLNGEIVPTNHQDDIKSYLPEIHKDQPNALTRIITAVKDKNLQSISLEDKKELLCHAHLYEFREELNRQMLAQEEERVKNVAEARKKQRSRKHVPARDGNQEDEEMVAFLNTTNSDGETLLHAAARIGSFSIIEELIGLGLNLASTNNENKTALELIKENKVPDQDEIIALLQTRQEWTRLATGFNANRVVHMLQKAEPLVNPACGHAKLLFVGPSGSGKSTFMNERFGSRYDINMAGGVRPEAKWVSGAEPVVQTGFGFQSTTLWPYVKGRDDREYVYVDLAGLFDNRGYEHKIIAASSTHWVSQMPGGIQGILVFIDLPTIVANLAEGLRHVSQALYSICQGNKDALKAVRYIITKVHPIANEGISPETIADEYLSRIIDVTRDESIKFMLQDMLDHPGNIFINDLTKEKGDEIDNAFKDLSPQLPNSFNFMLHDNAQENFSEFLRDLITQYITMKHRINVNIPAEMDREKHNILQIEEHIRQLEARKIAAYAQLNAPLVGLPLDERIEKINEELRILQTELTNTETEKEKINNRIIANQAILKEIDTDERFPVHTVTENFGYKERPEVSVEWRFGAPVQRITYPHNGWGNKSRELRYPNLTGKSGLDIDGTLVDYIEDPEGIGRYHIIFRASEGVSNYKVECLAQKRFLMENRERIPRIKQEIATDETALGLYDQKIQRLTKTKTDLEQERRSLLDEHIKTQEARRLELEQRITNIQQQIIESNKQMETSKKTREALQNEKRSLQLNLKVNKNLFSVIRKITRDLNMDGPNIREFQNSDNDYDDEIAPALPRQDSLIREQEHCQIIPFDDIEVHEPAIGEGGNGIVFKATWHQTNEGVPKDRTVAIKMLKGDMTLEMLDEFVHETGHHAQFNHANIVRLLGVCIEQDKKYSMVMEIMPNGSLYDVLHNKQPLPWLKRLDIAKDIIAGLIYLHGRDIIHRDLKSLNILLDAHFRAKLCDFGMAKVKAMNVDTISPNGGTICWMAPELFLGDGGNATKLSDMYAFGIVLWELASRETPFKDIERPWQVAERVKAGDRPEPRRPDGTPLSIARLIGRCWEQRREDRPQANEVLDVLNQETQPVGIPVFNK